MIGIMVKEFLDALRSSYCFAVPFLLLAMLPLAFMVLSCPLLAKVEGGSVGALHMSLILVFHFYK